jgi:hypothetical protein
MVGWGRGGDRISSGEQCGDIKELQIDWRWRNFSRRFSWLRGCSRHLRLACAGRNFILFNRVELGSLETVKLNVSPRAGKMVF